MPHVVGQEASPRHAPRQRRLLLSSDDEDAADAVAQDGDETNDDTPARGPVCLDYVLQAFNHCNSFQTCIRQKSKMVLPRYDNPGPVARSLVGLRHVQTDEATHAL